jgi:hypothetical protein
MESNLTAAVFTILTSLLELQDACKVSRGKGESRTSDQVVKKLIHSNAPLSSVGTNGSAALNPVPCRWMSWLLHLPDKEWNNARKLAHSVGLSKGVVSSGGGGGGGGRGGLTCAKR